MSAGSMRETVKALTTTFSASAVPDSLPDELHTIIDNFLERYDNIEDHDSQRFHEDLHTLYQRQVASSPEKHGAFLAVLRCLRPAITGEARLTVWWNLVLKPSINTTGHKRQELEDAGEFVLSILVYDAESDKDGEHARLSKLFAKKILDAYLARTSVPLSTEITNSQENELLAERLESVLVAFGRKMPKALLLLLDEIFVQKQYRIQALNLLSAFVRLQPPHLHLVLETPLIQHLEKCLLIDSSSTVIELALVVLIMFLPHICASLTSDHHLPKMFLIYSRVLCWDKLGSAEEPRSYGDDDDQDDDSQEESDGGEGESEQAWEPLLQSMEYPDSSPPTLMHYFTFLYGLYPLNFMSFVRKPRRFLKSLNFPGARDFDLDQSLIQSRSEPYRRVHLLHPNMFSTTAEDELHENIWLKSDPADVVTECMDLCVAVSSTLDDPGPPPTAALPAIPIPPIPQGTTQFNLDNGDVATAMSASTSERPEAPQNLESSKSTQSIMSALPSLNAHDVTDSPTLPPTIELKQDNIAEAPTMIPQSSIAKQPNLHNFVQSVTATNPSTNNEFHGQTLASLQREIMLLRNDLNFERYLKLQHLAHIGQLQRKHIKEATAEAETQNLINTNKTLRARLAKANEMYTQLKKETLTSRNQSKKWESDLSQKVRTYRDSEKTWHTEGDSLRYKLHRTQSDYDHLKQIVEKAEAEQIKAQQRTQALGYELEDYSNLRRNLEAAQEKIITLEDQRKELHALMQERNDLRNDLEISNMRLNSRELERERSIKAYERRIMDLETRLQLSERNIGRPGQLPSSVQQMLDAALAASHAKLQQLKKTHYHLLEQHTELQMKYHDLEAEYQAEQGRYRSQERSGHLDFEKARLGRSSSMGPRQIRNYGSGYQPPLATEESLGEERDQFHEYQSPNLVLSPSLTASSGRPPRSEAVQKTQRSQTAPSPYPNFGGSFAGPEFPSQYDASPNSHAQSQPQSSTTAQSSGKSSYSVDTEGSAGRDKKDKVDPKSEVRYYGRGGVQNISKKKDKDTKKTGTSKTGGFRGLKGIM